MDIRGSKQLMYDSGDGVGVGVPVAVGVAVGVGVGVTVGIGVAGGVPVGVAVGVGSKEITSSATAQFGQQPWLPIET